MVAFGIGGILQGNSHRRKKKGLPGEKERPPELLGDRVCESNYVKGT